MSVAFEAAWMLLKNAPMSEKEFYRLKDDDESMGGPSMPPMSRTMGGTPPANLGRAGSTGEIPRGRLSNREQTNMYGMDDVDDAGTELDFNDDASPAQQQQLIDRINQNIEPFNPFPKPLAGRVQDQLAEFADGAGRRAAMEPQADYTGDEFSMNSDDFKYDDESKLEESHPEAHNIASRNIRETPRKTKRGQIDEPRVTPRMQGRAARSPSPFVGGQPRSYFFGKSLDAAWSLLKALPEQREMAETGLPDYTAPSVVPRALPPVDMGTIHPGALSAMRRLQTDRRNSDLDTRSYMTGVGEYGFSPMPGRLMGTAADRALTRSGPNMPDEGAYYNPDTGRMEDQPHPDSERAKAARLQEILNRYN